MHSRAQSTAHHSTQHSTAHSTERTETKHKQSWKKHLHSVGSSSSLVFVLLIWINVIAARCILVSCFSCCFIHCIVIHGYNRVRWIPLSEYAPQRQRLIFNNLLLFRCVREWVCTVHMCVCVLPFCRRRCFLFVAGRALLFCVSSSFVGFFYIYMFSVPSFSSI